MPNAAKDNAPSTANPPSAKKGKNDTTVPATALRDIRNAAAFLALVNVYGQGITGEKAMEKEVAKHFFGDESSGLASTLKLLLTGGAAFEDLFEDVTTDDGTDCVLKKHCHGTNSYFVRGEHFDEDLLSRQAFTKADSAKIQGRGLLGGAKQAHANCKKAISMLRRLKGKVVNINGRGEVLNYASGMKEIDLMRYLNDGMYMLTQQKKAGETPIILVEGGDTATASAAGGPGNTSMGDAATGVNSSGPVDLTENGLFSTEEVELFSSFEEGGEDVEEAVDMPRPDDDWVPFGGVAPPSYRFPGYITLYCFGPHTQFYSMLLTTKGNSDEMKKSKTAGRKHQREQEAKRARVEQQHNNDRGMNIKTKVQIASVAQNEDGANMREREGRLASIGALIQSKQTMAERKLKYASYTSNEEREDDFVAEAMVIDEEIAVLNKQLEDLSNEKRGKNPIVEKVIEQAATLMGIGDNSAPKQVASVAAGGGNAVVDAAAVAEAAAAQKEYDVEHGSSHPNNSHLVVQRSEAQMTRYKKDAGHMKVVGSENEV